MKNKKVELLAPAGDLTRLKWAIIYGADAVYIGGEEYSLRANANNFSIEEIKQGAEFAHNNNSKIYVTVNIVFHNNNIKGLKEYLKKLEDCKIDAVIFSDPIVLEIVNELNLNFECHLSTQQSTLNYESVSFWEKQNVTRVVLGRETSKDEIIEIKKKTNVELETFIHGSMCLGYSGRCVLSNYMTNRDSNRGGCSQICRWSFNLLDSLENDITKNPEFTMCTKDLSMLKYIPDLIDIGVSSLKIEGRMRSIYYIATVVGIYRKVIDNYINNKDIFEYNKEYEKILRRCSNRDNAVQYFDKMPGVFEQYYKGRYSPSNQDFLGIVLEYNEKTKMAKIEQRNYFKLNDEIVIFSPNKENITMKIEKIIDDRNDEIEIVRHPKQIVYIYSKEKLDKYDILRTKF